MDTSNRLVEICKSTTKNTFGKTLHVYECSCGEILFARKTNVKSNNTLSCGCLKREQLWVRSFKHGQAIREKQSGAYKS